MIGNDIVDLEDPETRPESLHPGFDRRVFSPAEAAALAASVDPDAERWVLWAAKEAAYKTLRRLDPKTTFSPRAFEVDRGGAGGTVVRWRDRVLPIEIERRPGGVHALARLPETPREQIVWGASDTSGGDASRDVRELARRTVASELGRDEREVRVERHPGEAPLLHWDPEAAPLPISLSHHGRLVAFACELPLEAG